MGVLSYTMNNMPPVGQIYGSQVAATGSIDPRTRSHIQKARLDEGQGAGFNTDTVLEFMEGGVPIPLPLPGVQTIGNVAGAGIGFVVANRKAEKETNKLVNQYRDVIAEQLGIPENKVDMKALLFAARKNKKLERALHAIEDERGSHPFINIFSVSGMALGLVLGMPIPVIGWIVGPIIGGFVGSWMGNAMLAPDPMMNPQQHMREIFVKADRRQPVSMRDIFALRVSQHPDLNEKIINQYGKSFFALSPRDQTHVFNHYAGLAQQCERDAQLCNQGGNAGQLMFGPMVELPSPIQEFQDLRAAANGPAFPEPQPEQAAGLWAQRVGGPQQARTGGFVDRLAQQRAQAALAQNELS